MHMDISEEAVYARIYNENVPGQGLENLGGQALCEPAQSKGTWTCHKSHSMREFTVKMPVTKIGAQFMRACAVETRMDMSQEFFCENLQKKMPGTKIAMHSPREPAQSKCTWTCHKSHFMREFTGKMPGPRSRCTVYMGMSQESFYS